MILSSLYLTSAIVLPIFCQGSVRTFLHICIVKNFYTTGNLELIFQKRKKSTPIESSTELEQEYMFFCPSIMLESKLVKILQIDYIH